MSEKRSKEKDRLIAAINEILHATDSLWILEQIYRCAKNMTREDSE